MGYFKCPNCGGTAEEFFIEYSCSFCGSEGEIEEEPEEDDES